MNCRHNESRSMVEAEGEQDEVAGVRNHSTRGIGDAGRRGGGYVVGNAWGGAEADESGHGSCWNS